jgi:putative ABC transport system permease protein
MILGGISCLIAMPVAWYILSGAIKRYEYKTTLGWHIFLLTGAGALLVTLFTVSFQALKAAYANPVNSLRSE